MKGLASFAAVAAIVMAYFFPYNGPGKIRAFFEVSTNLVTWDRYCQPYPTNGAWLCFTNSTPGTTFYFRCGFVQW